MNPENLALLEAVMEAHPLLTHFGYGEYDNACKATPENRARLLSAVDEIQAARAWLSTQTPRLTLNHRRSSYGLKHIASKATRCYIANGSFIAAALMDGWIVKRIPKTPNARINLSETALRLSIKARS